MLVHLYLHLYLYLYLNMYLVNQNALVSVWVRVRLHLWWPGDLRLPWARLCLRPWIYTVETLWHWSCEFGKTVLNWNLIIFWLIWIGLILILTDFNWFWFDFHLVLPLYSEYVLSMRVLAQLECHQSALEVDLIFIFIKGYKILADIKYLQI